MVKKNNSRKVAWISHPNWNYRGMYSTYNLMGKTRNLDAKYFRTKKQAVNYWKRKGFGAYKYKNSEGYVKLIKY